MESFRHVRKEAVSYALSPGSDSNQKGFQVSADDVLSFLPFTFIPKETEGIWQSTSLTSY